MQLNLYAAWLLVPAVISAALALFALKKQNATHGRIFSLTMFAVSFWSLAYAMELASTTQATAQFWLKIEYLAIPFVSLLMMLTVLNHSGMGQFFSKGQLLLLTIIPATTSLLAITHEYHTFYYKKVEMTFEGPIPLLRLDVGFWYYINVVYVYLLNLFVLGLLVRKLIQQKSIFRQQAFYMFMVVLIPMVFFTLYIARLLPIRNVDPTPFAFTLSGIFAAIGIFRYRLLDLVPIARDHVIRSMPDGLWVFDNRLRLVDYNPVAQRIFDWPSKLYGKTPAELWPDYPDLARLVETMSETSKKEIVVQIPDDQYYLFSPSDIMSTRQQFAGRLLLARNITLRHRLQQAVEKSEAKLRESNAEKDKLFNIIAHDLRSPMAAFIQLTSLAVNQTDELSREELREIAKILNRSAESLSGLLENLLHWARLQREDISVRPEILRLKDSIQNTAEIFREMIRLKNLQLELEVPEPLLIYADQHMFATITRNLLSNAIKFTRPGGVIRISAQTTDSNATSISFSDTGIGIPADILRNLFSINQSNCRPGTDGESSSGLGLVLCKEFVARNHGSLTVTSEPGKGTTFVVTLPSQKPQ